MIEGSTPSGNPVTGGGLVVGKSIDGRALIVTARHVVLQGAFPNSFHVRFYQSPANPVEATLEKADFGRDLDLALISAPLPERLSDIDFSAGIPVGRLSDDFTEGEPAKLIGHPEGSNWTEAAGQQKITTDQGATVQVLSFDAGPGSSGGIALDSSDRIIGMMLSDDRYTISVLKLSVIATQFRTAGLPFSVSHREARDLIPESEYEGAIRSLLTSGSHGGSVEIAPNGRAVGMVNRLLEEPETLRAFTENFSSADKLRWMGALINVGFDPNRLVRDGDRRTRSLLHIVLASNNVDLATTMLREGATPYGYSDLWGQEHSRPFLLFPLEWFDELSLSREQKTTLILAMLKAGLTTSDIAMPESYWTNEQMDDLSDTTVRIETRYGVDIPVQNALGGSADRIICERAARIDDYNWCRDAGLLPARLRALSDGWHPEFVAADLVKLLGVFNDVMLVMTFSPEGGTAPAGYGVMEISKGAERIVWYRFMGAAVGMGHCEELRRVPNWQPNEYETCWKRQEMNVGASDNEYFVPKYPSVRYSAQ